MSSKGQGFIAYVVEVSAHLVWCYFVLSIVFYIPVALAAAIEVVNAGQEFNIGSFFSSPFFEVFRGNLLLGVHLISFMKFRSIIWPRFRHRSPLVTYLLSASLGSILMGSLLGYLTEWPSIEKGIYFAGFLALLGGAADRFQYHWGGGSGAPLGIARWFGRLLVGRANYDAFVEWDATRLHTEYEDHVESVRAKGAWSKKD
ncbi:MAG: hypothetical protein ABL973_01245 [Micropepsaceae bacterium]